MRTLPTITTTALLAGLWACGAEPIRRPPLPDGRAVYVVRYNPPACAANRTDLHVEVQTPQGWERVALEPPEEEGDDLAQALLDRFDEAPDDLRQVEAVFTRAEVLYSGRHRGRVLRVLDLDPEVPDAP